jgi:hypothetical protein
MSTGIEDTMLYLSHHPCKQGLELAGISTCQAKAREFP